MALFLEEGSMIEVGYNLEYFLQQQIKLTDINREKSNLQMQKTMHLKSLLQDDDMLLNNHSKFDRSPTI